MKIVIAQHKGGVGKTTLAVHIAAVISSRFNRTLLIDCDSQGDAFHFFTKKFPNKELDVEQGMDYVSVVWNPNRKQFSNKGAFSEYSNIVVDIDTRVTNALQVILEVNPDLILIPVDNQRLSYVHGLQVLEIIEGVEGSLVYSPRKAIVEMGAAYEDYGNYTKLNIPYHIDFDRCLNESDYIWNMDNDLEYMFDLFKRIAL